MKRSLFLTLLCLLLCAAVPASASLASLDGAMAPLLEGRGSVTFTAAMTLQALPPFDETRIALFNRVLGHLRLRATIDLSNEAQTVGFALLMDDTSLMELGEQNRDGAYLLQTSLLPNRRLFSTAGSPIDALLASSGGQPEEAAITSALNTSNVEEAFDFPAAAAEMAGCYQKLTNQTSLLAEKKTANYSIENVGKGRVSYVARLTAEQSGALLPELRALLSCGMDAEYRAELGQITFANGFVVALYQNADEQDICVYMKGTVLYPDGDQRSVKWQWAFTPDGQTQTFAYTAARESGTRDSRLINATLKRTGDDKTFAWKEKTEAILRRSSQIDASTLTVDLKGDAGDTPTCKGSVKRVTESVAGNADPDKAETAITVDLALRGTQKGAELTGSADYAETLNRKPKLQVTLAFLPSLPADAAETPAPADTDAGTATPAPTVQISIIRADTVPPDARPGISQEAGQEFLVGSVPLGLTEYPVPPETITVDVGGGDPAAIQALMAEAAQRLAGQLVLAILDLPAEDRALLSDGMTDADYAMFLAMLD